MVNRNRHSVWRMHDYEDEDMEELEANPMDYEPETPWNFLRTRLDMLSYINPMDALKYYFVRHSTGPSYAYFITSLLLLIVFSIMRTRRLQVDAEIEVISKAGFDYAHHFNLPTNSLKATISTLGADSFEWQFDRCKGTSCPCDSQTTCETSSTCPGVDETDTTKLCGNPSSIEYIRSAPQFSNFVWFRGRAVIKDEESRREVLSDATLSFSIDSSKWSLRSTPNVMGLRYTVKGKATLSSNKKTVITIYYQPVFQRKMGEYLADFSEQKFAVYDHYDISHVDLESNGLDPDLLEEGVAVAEINIRIMTSEKRIIYQTDSIFDALMAIAVMLVMVLFFGRIFYFYNRWHFNRYGKMEYARLPSKYTDHLLDPYDFRQPLGYETLVKKRMSSRTVNPKTIKAMYEEVFHLREELSGLVDGPEEVKSK